MKKLLLLFSVINANQVYAIGLEKCFDIAANHYQIPSNLLKAIARTETGMNPTSVGVNKNRTYDIGLMQINSSWLPKLNRVGITQKDLIDPCNNIQIGAWILAGNIKRYGFGIKAIGAYNATTPKLQQKYADKVMRNMKEIR